MKPSHDGMAPLAALTPGEQDAVRPQARIATVLRLSALALGAGLMMWLLSSVVLLLFFAVLLATTLRGASQALASRLRVPVNLVVGVIAFLLLLLVAGFWLIVGPSLAQQGSDLIEKLRGEGSQLVAEYGRTGWGKEVVQHLQQGAPAAEVAAPAMHVLSLTLDTVAGLVLLVITALYLALSPDLYIDGFIRLMPISRRAQVRSVMHVSGRTLQRWLMGQLVDMAAVGVLTGIGLGILGVPSPLALAALAGILTFIPYFGAVLAGIPAVLVALSQGPKLALWTLGVFVLTHLIEGYVISPLVQKRMVELPPAITVLSMTAAGALFGPLGIVLGTPLAAAGIVLVREFYVADMLGDDEMRCSS